MARATTKADLIESSSTQYEKLWKLIDSMSQEEQNASFLFEDRDKNLRDVLIHLYEWHNLILKWIESNSKGEYRPFLPEPYNWRTYPNMNIEIWEKHQGTSLEQSKNMLRQTHIEVMKLVEPYTNDELFSKGVYKWTKGSTLGSYFVSSTASHYDWAVKKLKKHIKSYRGEKNK